MCLVCDFDRENHKSETCVCDFCVYVCVCDFGPKNHKSKFAFLILDWAGHEGMGPDKAGLGWKKNPLIKRAGSRSQ